MKTSYECPEAQVLNRTEPEKESFWKRFKNFFKRFVGRPIKKVGSMTKTGLKKTGKVIEFITRIVFLSPLGQLMFGILGIYFVLWAIGAMYTYIGGFAFLAIIPVIGLIAGIEFLILALNESSMRMVAEKKRQRGYA